MKIAVLSDIHANYDALHSAIREISKLNVDKTIFLGDLLTYGCKINQTVTLLKSFSFDNDVIFVSGNHDEIYFNKQNGLPFEYKPFPDFILESVEATSQKLSCDLKSEFKWVKRYAIDGVIFSHANLKTYGDWSYINSDEDVLKAACQVSDLGYRGAVFGHTHRSKIFEVSKRKIISGSYSQLRMLDDNTVFIANSGSVGQPRGTEASFLLINTDENIELELINFKYNINSHIDSITNSDLSSSTKKKLVSFYHRKPHDN
ncbi:metallophosphoesterase family protein [Vibrio lentus]|uniref:metallophosphoesterase family protein n=1 Tax=Vibrio lentus TaxID=136468 RepID=UPI000C848614|nr:metallophosphoesterase family protein [Vibrio lentus]PMJ90122.1 hypothetical protein BCU14_24745 [Vibrio lentus]PMN41936.1 hypothetical protein BCT33_00290 [Vibrio lentus]PMN59038.1 hypothetical protein BCT29_25165 [Vibrio lentus]